MDTFFKMNVKIQASKQNSITCLLSEVLQLWRAFRRGECSHPFCLLLSAFLCLTFVLVSWSAHMEKDNFRNTWVTPHCNRSHLSLIFHVFITTGLIWKSTKASKNHTGEQRRAREAMRQAGRFQTHPPAPKRPVNYGKLAAWGLKQKWSLFETVDY